jgi:aryl-alcohol dehydrogenase-like predicted oxidoreductase
MRTRPFAKTGIDVGAVGFGAMPLSRSGGPSEDESLGILTRLAKEGITFLDTADTYCPSPNQLHHNERLLRRASSAWHEEGREVIFATKGGMVVDSGGWYVNGSPDHLYRAICTSYEALGGHQPIPLWQLHWPDPRFTIASMLQPVLRAVEEGLVQFVGVCNFSLDQLRRAQDMVPIVSVQNQFNLWHREPETEGILEYCEQQDLVFLPWRPFGGLGLAQTLGRIEPLIRLASERQVTPQRLMVAWHLAKSTCIVPIPGSSRLDHILDGAAAEELHLEQSEVRRVDAISMRDLPNRKRASAWEGMPPLADLKPARG